MAVNYREQKRQRPKEEYAIILDVITDNKNFRNNTIVQAIGTSTYILLELIPKEGVTLNPGDKVYIGDGKRDEIQFIKRAIYPDKLTATAKSELLFTIMDIVDEREEEYINFINKIGPVTIRKHALELITGVGKKHLKDLIELREEKPFKDFKDVKERCSFLPDPQKAFAQRILNEIEGKTEHLFFIKR